MRILCAFGEHNYGDPARGQGYEYSNFLPALRNLGHQVQFFDSFSRTRYDNFAELNRSLLETAERFQPDALFCVLMGYEIWLDTFAIMRAAGIRLINWGTDDSWKYEQFSRYVAPIFDIWVTTSHVAYRKALRDGLKNFVLSQWAARSDAMAPPLTAQECRYTVSFIGSAYGNRPRWVDDMKSRGIDVVCFGHGWPRGAVSAADIPRIIRESVISLNFADSGLQLKGLRPYRSRQIKARVFEVPGAGGCLLTEAGDHLQDYYLLGSEIEVFHGHDDLAAKIQYLLAHPDMRNSVALAGYRRTQGEHTYEARFEVLFSKLQPRTTIRPLNFSIFEECAARHRIGPFAKLLRSMLVAPFRLIWGSHRGPRAARRFLFELTWPVAGRSIYTASGWLGRLFYKES